MLKGQVAVLRLHAAPAGHVTKAAYACLKIVYVLQGTKHVRAPMKRRTSENSVKRKSNFRERVLSNKRSVRMFAATSGKGCHVLPTSRRPSFVLISFGSEEIRPSRLSHLQPSQYDRAQRCPNRRALRRARHRERTSIRLRCVYKLRILNFLRH